MSSNFGENEGKRDGKTQRNGKKERRGSQRCLYWAGAQYFLGWQTTACFELEWGLFKTRKVHWTTWSNGEGATDAQNHKRQARVRK